MSQRLSQLLIALAVLGPAACAENADHSCRLSMDVPTLVRDSRVVLFGEVHGTVEAPAFVGEYACWLNDRGYSVVIGLEIPQREQLPIDTYVDGSGSLQERIDLLRGLHWESPDGRASEAMLTLIERVRQLRRSGAKISILAFDGWSNETSRDALMASNIIRSFNPTVDGKLVALVGNIHAMKAIGGPFDSKFEPMGYHLSSLKPVSLAIDFEEGAAWYCSSECGVHELLKNRAHTSTGFQLGISALPGYDGTLLLPMATPSYRARERIPEAYKPLVPTRKGEAPLLAAQRRRYAVSTQ